MKAVVKTRPEPGVEIVEVAEPSLRPGHVKIQLEAASVCGTDLHIYRWDAWAAGRIQPPRILGHEFCGTIVEVAPDVTDRTVGQFVASESHIVPASSAYLQAGLGHVAPETQILGVDVDGGFAPWAVVPAANARPTDPKVPREIAAFQDALGNAVHTVYDDPHRENPVGGLDVLITGCGPIGLFAIGICRALGARTIAAVEVSPYRIELARKMGVDWIGNPRAEDVSGGLARSFPEGFHATLEMSGHASSLDLAVTHTRAGGRISLLGVFGEAQASVRLNDVIFKGLRLQGIVGRRLWKTWDQMGALLASGKLDLSPVVTHVMAYTDFARAMELLEAGQAGKVVFTFEDTPAAPASAEQDR